MRQPETSQTEFSSNINKTYTDLSRVRVQANAPPPLPQSRNSRVLAATLLLVFRPTAVQGVTKYGPNGNFSADTFRQLNASEEMKNTLAAAANHAIAKKTWSTYTTAARMRLKCEEETGVIMNLPMAESQTLVLVGWWLNRGLAATTINSYLAGIRQEHITAGLGAPDLRTPLVCQIIEGKKKLDQGDKANGVKPTRLPVTPLILRTWKAELIASAYSSCDKLLLWAASSLAFAGTFRCHELLARNSNSFDPKYTLLGRDLKIKSIKVNKEVISIIQVNIKSEKTDRVGVNTVVDVYENGGALCPVKALIKWKAVSKAQDDDLPAFRWESGKPLTGGDFNKALKALLSRHFDYNKSKISGHSFRAGLPTLAGSLGYTDAEIQALGRWSSRAFNAYLKMPRTHRLEMARKMAANLN